MELFYGSAIQIAECQSPQACSRTSTVQPQNRRPDQHVELQSLTPLRGMAALWVVLYHYTVLYFPSIHPETYTHFIEKGYLAVDMFFVLSGFVLAHVYRDAFVDDPESHYWKFFSARVARLYPLHIFVLTLFLATALAARAVDYAATGKFAPIPWEGARSVGAFVANLFMLQGLKASELSWNYPAWSISIEFLAYLVFPFALLRIWRARRAAKVALGFLLLGMLVWLAYWTKDNFNQWDGPKTLLRCLPEFVGGMILYNFYARRQLPFILRSDFLFVGIAAALIVLLHFGAADLLIIMLLPVVVLAAVMNTGYAGKLLNILPLIWLGQISYSLYLIHGFVQFVTTRLLAMSDVPDKSDLSVASSIALALAMLFASVCLAAMTYYGVEKIGRRYLRKMLGVQARRRTAAVVPEPIPARSQPGAPRG